MKKAMDISAGSLEFALSEHSEPYLVRGFWQQTRVEDGSIHIYLPFNCLEKEKIWERIKSDYDPTNPKHWKFWERAQRALKGDLKPIWAAMEVTQTGNSLGCVPGETLKTNINIEEWIATGKEYDEKHASACFTEQDYMAMNCVAIQSGLLTLKELTQKPSREIGVCGQSVPAKAGTVKLFGDLSPYGNVMRFLHNSWGISSGFVAGYSYLNTEIDEEYYAADMWEDSYKYVRRKFQGGLIKMQK